MLQSKRITKTKGPGKPLLLKQTTEVQIGYIRGVLCLMYRKNIIHPLNTELWFINF